MTKQKSPITHAPDGTEYLNLDLHPPRIAVEFRQGETSLGTVEEKEWYNSGEASQGLLPESIREWNSKPQQIKDGVTAHIVILYGDVENERAQRRWDE